MNFNVRRMGKNFGRLSVSVLVVAIAAVTFAVQLSAETRPPAAVPEIDGASLSAGLGLLGAGILYLRARRKVK
jgi:hypothetical protein